MNNIGEKFLPLGTVVMLKGATKRLMITGFCSMAANEENAVMYDYAGCMYPEGFVSSDQTALFNHDQIEKVYHLGLVDQEEKDFKIKLNQLLYSNSVVSETTPSGIREQQGIDVAQAQASTVPAVETVPPVGPGLPGYVAPQPSAPVATQTVDGYSFDANGNVVQAPVATQTVDGYSFDENGNVIQAPVAAQPTAPAPVQPVNIQFDENGTVISA